VTPNAYESASNPVYADGGASDPTVNTSRVVRNGMTTRVRVDSIKLFEVSSFSAIVEHSLSSFPLLPLFVEISYISCAEAEGTPRHPHFQPSSLNCGRAYGLWWR
jgi:hypothetical protein